MKDRNIKKEYVKSFVSLIMGMVFLLLALLSYNSLTTKSLILSKAYEIVGIVFISAGILYAGILYFGKLKSKEPPREPQG